MTSLITVITILDHFIFGLDQTLTLILWERQSSVHHQDCHHSSVTPEGPVEAEVVEEERVELDGTEHVDSSAGTTDTRGVGSEQNIIFCPLGLSLLNSLQSHCQ